MTHVILQNCCVDGACVDVCPVNCIHPRVDETAAGTTAMLFVDPDVCIDCGACADVCPVGAVAADYDLRGGDRGYIEVNAAYFRQPGARDYTARRPDRPFGGGATMPDRALGVAIVGTGPAACYAAAELLDRVRSPLRVDMFERLASPGGLARFGVAPDHARTRAAVDTYARVFDDPRVAVHFGVEVGRDVTADTLAASYDAVIYAVGASADRPLGISGEALIGSHSATEFVGWYNGHPDQANARFDLSSGRAIVIGNGNVALDIARILTRDPAGLDRTDMAEGALAALRESHIDEVAILGRRDPLAAAFTFPELRGLRDHDDIAVWTDFPEDLGEALRASAAGRAADWSTRRKLDDILALPRQRPARGRSIRLSFLRSPQAVIGEERAIALRQGINRLEIDDVARVIRVEATDRSVVEDAGLIIRAAGFRGRSIAGVAFDTGRGTIPNVGGRVVDPATGRTVVGAFVTGWIKRGPSGTMGTNKACARETVTAILDDLAAGRIGGAEGPDAVGGGLSSLPPHITLADWRASDRREKTARRGRDRVRTPSIGPDRAAPAGDDRDA